MKKTQQYLIGAHVSVSGGFENAIIQGMEIGCTVVQIFTKSNRQWHARSITQQEADIFITTQKNSSIAVVVAHASYLINLGSSTPDVQTKSLQGLIKEIQRCDILRIPFLILHPGSGQTQEELEHIGSQINIALEKTAETNVCVLVETMAGQGKTAGSNFKELGTILQQVSDKKRIGICFDTCHVFVAGYDFSTEEKYKKMMDDFDKEIGLNYLKAFHINDSKKELNSRVDRHENIGQGAIPLQSFSFILNDTRFQNVPKILETPKDETLESDKQNLHTLLNLLQ